MALAGSKTEDNLKAAFAGESQANRRYLYFAQKADVEGYNDVAAVFRSTAEARPAMPTAISSSSRRPVIRPPASRSAAPTRT
jgi:rubrerythrin